MENHGYAVWELMAYDIADLLSINAADYEGGVRGLDLTETSILPNLPAFIAACQATQAELDATEVNDNAHSTEDQGADDHRV